MNRLHDLRTTGRLVQRELPTGDLLEQVEKHVSVEIAAYDPEARRISVVASDETIDRYGDVVEVAGWDLAAYRRNPVVLIDHTYRVSALVGQADVRADKGRLIADITHDPPERNVAAAMVHDRLMSGSLRTVSVGFRPLTWKSITDDDGKWTGYRFTKQELLEISWVVVPANPNALVTDALEASEIDDLARRVRELVLRELVNTALAAGR